MNFHRARISLLGKAVFAGIITLVVLFIFGVPTVTAQTPPPQTSDSVTEEVSLAENAEVVKALEELLASMKMEDFVYQIEERPDPFMPFISEKVIQPVESDFEETEKLTGMRQFEPGQLNLVAIMFTESNPMAMVEDSSHKGYIIRRGTKIGKSGIVSDILPNQVIIKQLSYSMTKERKYKTVEMILRKEGEK
jgi:Tfp pilus assembly protein PilP